MKTIFEVSDDKIIVGSKGGIEFERCHDINDFPGLVKVERIVRNASLPRWCREEIDKGNVILVSEIKYDPETRWVKVIGKSQKPIKKVEEISQEMYPVSNMIEGDLDNGKRTIRIYNNKQQVEKTVVVDDNGKEIVLSKNYTDLGKELKAESREVSFGTHSELKNWRTGEIESLISPSRNFMTAKKEYMKAVMVDEEIISEDEEAIWENGEFKYEPRTRTSSLEMKAWVHRDGSLSNNGILHVEDREILKHVEVKDIPETETGNLIKVEYGYNTWLMKSSSRFPSEDGMRLEGFPSEWMTSCTLTYEGGIVINTDMELETADSIKEELSKRIGH